MEFEVLCLSLKTDTHRREHMENVFKNNNSSLRLGTKKISNVRILHSGTVHFVQLDDKFKSNIAPNGYNKY